MKKRVLTLALSAALALSSTSAFAAETNCTRLNNIDYSNLLKNIVVKTSNNQYKIELNGKNFNSIDWKTVLKQDAPKAPAEKPQEPVQKPAERPQTSVETPTEPVEKPSSTQNTTVSSSNLTYEQKVVELVNVERQKAGLPELKMDSAISNVARAKSKDMAVNNYFAHQSPTYGSAGDMLRQFGINWSAWGENIASGQRTPEIVVNAWMNSSGHRANILSTNFSKIGVGYVTNANGTPYWTQIFTN